MSSDVYAHLFGDPDVDVHFSDRTLIQICLDVEVALVDAQAALGLVPVDVVGHVHAAARAEDYDIRELALETARDGNLVIPLVRAMRSRVSAVAPHASAYVHRGATSQDVLDTAAVIQISDAVPIILGRLHRAREAARAHAATHVNTAMPGRTWLQQATPITFGLMAAGWADALGRSITNVRAALDAAVVVQLGGATGTLAAFGAEGPRLVGALAEHFYLGAPRLSWHAHRDRFVSVACALAVAVGTLAKIAKDISLLVQTEVGEVSIDRPGGGSSTMPHKRNPVGPAVILAASLRTPGLLATLVAAMPQELQRGLGGWHAEWTALPELVSVAGGAAKAAAETLEALKVDPARMRENLGLTSGVIMAEAVTLALAEHIDRDRAHAIVAAASRRALAERRTLAATLAEDDTVARIFDPTALEALTNPERYLGSASLLVARALERAGD